MTNTEQFTFQAETARLLEIVTHSLYSQREIFLRELISNASDACDRLRYQAITAPELLGDQTLKIEIKTDKNKKTLTLSDNGLGMSREEMIDNLGTIARSGTKNFVAQLKETKDLNQIGQFGVGFYAAFMVAKSVDVISRKADSDEAFQWSSEGTGQFTVEPASRDTQGTTITLHLKDDAEEFMDEFRIKHLVKQYSDHVAFPITLNEDAASINKATAVWQRSKNDITEEEYREFYHNIGLSFDDPWATFHWHAEGVIDYRALLYIPSTKPMDLFDPKRDHKVKLYVKRVFITEHAEGLIPRWLRFLRGVVDSGDLPLNVSREMLQYNPVLVKIRQGIIKKVLGELAKRAETKPEDFALFNENFGAVLKEGLYEDVQLKDELFKVLRFHSTYENGTHMVSMADYVSRMKDGQSEIYYIAGDDVKTLQNSVQLEGFKARGLEVLLFTDPIDEFWLPAIVEFDGKPFKSITKAGVALDQFKRENEPEKPAEPRDDNALDLLIAAFKTALGDAVKDVRLSNRLTSSAVCLVSDEKDIDIRMERLLKVHNQYQDIVTRILEINPDHSLIKTLADQAAGSGQQDNQHIENACWLLFEEARLLEGEKLFDAKGFSDRLSQILQTRFA